MSPTLFWHKGFRFFFFSREETRMHVHVSSANGEAKFWLEPEIELARNYGLSSKEVREMQAVVEERRDGIAAIWRKRFPG